MVISKAKAAPVKREQVDQKLLAVGQTVLDLELTEAEMQREIDAVKARYARPLHEQREAEKAAGQALRLAVEDSRPVLFPGKGKTISLLFGKCGFRMQPDRVVLAEGVTGEQAATLLENKQLRHLIRISKEPAKDSIRQRLADGEVDASLLEKCGIIFRDGGEDFWYKIDRASVREYTPKD